MLAYVCGLYALDDLRSWASGVGDAPRLAVTSLLISWPVFGLLTALDARHARCVGALTAAVVTGAGAGDRPRRRARRRCTARPRCASGR